MGFSFLGGMKFYFYKIKIKLLSHYKNNNSGPGVGTHVWICTPFHPSALCSAMSPAISSSSMCASSWWFIQSWVILADSLWGSRELRACTPGFPQPSPTAGNFLPRLTWGLLLLYSSVWRNLSRSCLVAGGDHLGTVWPTISQGLCPHPLQRSILLGVAYSKSPSVTRSLIWGLVIVSCPRFYVYF